MVQNQCIYPTIVSVRATYVRMSQSDQELDGRNKAREKGKQRQKQIGPPETETEKEREAERERDTDRPTER